MSEEPKLSIMRFEIDERRRRREGIKEKHENLLFINGFFTELDITPALDSKCIPKELEKMTEITPDCIVDQGFVLAELQDERERLKNQFKKHEVLSRIREKTKIKGGVTEETWEEMGKDLQEDIVNMGEAFNKAVRFFRK